MDTCPRCKAYESELADYAETVTKLNQQLEAWRAYHRSRVQPPFTRGGTMEYWVRKMEELGAGKTKKSQVHGGNMTDAEIITERTR